MENRAKEIKARIIGEENLTDIELNGKTTKALIDSGSVVSTISESLYRNLPDKPQLHNMTDFGIIIETANGTSLPYLGYIEADIILQNQGKAFPTLLLVVPNTEYHNKVPVLLGTNIIRDVRQSLKDNQLPDEWKTAVLTISSSAGTVVATRNINLKPMETRTVTGITRKTTKHETVITEGVEDANHNAVICPRVITLKGHGKTARIPVRICNLSTKPIKIHQKQVLCNLQEVKVIDNNMVSENALKCSSMQETEQQNVNNKNDNKKKENKVNFDLTGTDLNTKQKQKVLELFEKWQSVIPKGPNDLGHTGVVKHNIKLSDEKPFKEPCRRIPPAIYNEVKEHLKEMLNIGAIRPSKSPWSSNVVVVRKKDGTIRFCIDFRKLNSRTKKDAYPIPKIEDTLHMLSGSKYFSKIDLKSGYWQVEMEEEDKEKTAFQVPGVGFYECNRMPFGLSNSPATFQRLMERCMGDMNLQDCLIYLDDIIVFSNNIEEHIKRLDKVFQRLHEYNLKINPKKCEFFKKSVTYLGHVVSDRGIQTDPKKIEDVVNWPRPKTVRDVRKFLGFAGYYRRFIKDFSTIARPLNNLLIGHPTKDQKKAKLHNKRTPFAWNNEQEDAFKNLKFMITNAPILAYADYTLPFTVHTDASTKGLGAVLYQKHDNKDRVVAFASRSLKTAERNYPAHKLEFLALKWAVSEKFHDYLYGSEFTVITDNNPLTYVTTTAKLDATGHRWLASLANYNFQIKYRPGKQNADADGLSRIKTETLEKPSVDAIITAKLSCESFNLNIINPEENTYRITDTISDVPEEIITAESLCSKDWRKAQIEDTVMSELHRHIKQGTKPAKPCLPQLEQYTREWSKLELRDGVLYRRNNNKSQTCLQLLLPEKLRDTIFSALHDDLGHQGRDRTTSLFKERFYWPGMDNYIRSKVAKCERCIRRKTPTQTAPLEPISSSAPMELICVDFLSMESSKGGYENVLVITDHFTRYAQAFPTTSQTARTTAKVLFDKFFVHYGFPEKLHSDQGSNFTSQLIEELCKLTGISKTRTTPYHPMGNGMVERFNQTLLQMLGTLDEEKKSDWKSHVAPLVHAYNVTSHNSTGFSPYYLMFGRHPRLAIDALLGLQNDNISEKYTQEYARKLKTRLTEAYNKAKTTALETSKNSKQLYDKRARYTKLIPGDLVLVRNVSVRGKCKLGDKWEKDPYIVIAQPNPEIPVFDVKKNISLAKRVRRLHRNLLVPLGMSSECKTTDDLITSNMPSTKYVIPQRRPGYTDNSDSDDSEVIRPQRRSNRIRRQPQWYRAVI